MKTKAQLIIAASQHAALVLFALAACRATLALPTPPQSPTEGKQGEAFSGHGHVTTSDLAATKREPVVTAWVHAVGSVELHVIDATAQDFNERHSGWKVEIVASQERQYEDRVRGAAAAGALPCLLEFDGPYLDEYARAGLLQPLDRFVSRELVQDLLPSIRNQGTYEGRLYSLGQFDSGLALWANLRYLHAAHVRIPTIDKPWSLAEFEEALARLASVQGVEYPLDLGVYASGTEFFSYAFAPILQGFGGDLIERRSYRSARGVLDGPRSVTAMTRFQRWFREGWTRAVTDRADDFAKGRAALSWNGHWQWAGFHAALGADLVLLPLPDLGSGIKTGSGSWTWGITSTCRNPRVAWEFLASLMSTHQILRMTNSNGAIPARRSALALSPLYQNRGPLRIFVQQLSHGCGVPRPRTPTYGAISHHFSDAVAAIIAGGDVQTELSGAARAIEADVAAPNGNDAP